MAIETQCQVLHVHVAIKPNLQTGMPSSYPHISCAAFSRVRIYHTNSLTYSNNDTKPVVLSQELHVCVGLVQQVEHLLASVAPRRCI